MMLASLCNNDILFPDSYSDFEAEQSNFSSEKRPLASPGSPFLSSCSTHVTSSSCYTCCGDAQTTATILTLTTSASGPGPTSVITPNVVLRSSAYFTCIYDLCLSLPCQEETPQTDTDQTSFRNSNTFLILSKPTCFSYYQETQLPGNTY